MEAYDVIWKDLPWVVWRV